jgi:hypothetical protein
VDLLRAPHPQRPESLATRTPGSTGVLLLPLHWVAHRAHRCRDAATMSREAVFGCEHPDSGAGGGRHEFLLSS